MKAKAERKVRIGTLAWVLCVAILGTCLHLFILTVIGFRTYGTVERWYFRYSDRLLLNTDPEPTPGIVCDPSMYIPGKESVYVFAQLKKNVYREGEQIKATFDVGLWNDDLGDGDLEIRIFAEAFTVEMEGATKKGDTFVIENFTHDRYPQQSTLRLTLRLTPNFEEDWVTGQIDYEIDFRPADAEAFRDRVWQEEKREAILEDGCVPIAGFNDRNFVSHRGELWISYRRDVPFLLLKNQYARGLISGKTLAETYYKDQYEGVYELQTARTYMIDGNRPAGVAFSYNSEYIRYNSDRIMDDKMFRLSEECDPVIGEKLNEEKRQELRDYVLRYMRDEGIITEAEYERELLPLAGSNDAGYYIGYPFFWQSILDHYRYTHK